MDLQEMFQETEQVSEPSDQVPASEDSKESAEAETKPAEQSERDKAETGEKTDSVTPTEETSSQEVTVPLKALESERAKRQELEHQLIQLQSEKPENKAPDIADDPEGYAKHMDQKVQKAVMNERLNMSEIIARQQYPDLDSKVETFKTLMEQNPDFGAQVQSSASPYHEVVKIVDAHNELQQLKNVDSMKAKLRAEVESEVREKLTKEFEAKQALSDSIPQSLAAIGSKGSINGSEWAGPPSLQEAFKGG